VCSNEDVDFSDGKVTQDLFDLFGFSKAVQRFDAHGVAVKPGGEGFEVLLGQQGGGHEDGDLFGIEDSAHGGAHGDFGFAEADVAADEPFHGPRLLHVFEDGLNGFVLVWGFGVVKTRFEGLKVGVWRREGEAWLLLSFGVEIEEVDRELADALPDFLFGAFPGAAAQFVEFVGFFCAGVLLDTFETLDGDVEFAFFGVDDVEEIAFDAADF